MKHLCLAISLLAYSGYANAISIQLAANESKSESDRMFKFNQQIPTAKVDKNKDLEDLPKLKVESTKTISDPTKNANTITCFNNKSGVGLVQSKDLEGRDVLAFPLDRLRNNVRYGFVENYKQGFSRIKKDGVWGYLNLCGDEAIACQYEKAEPYNEGKALVKRQSWLFINTMGNESEEFQNIVDAKSLSKGLSLVKFKTNQMALIDNNYDKTLKPVSALYDDIIVLNDNVLAVKVNTKWGIFKLGEGAIAEAFE
jgi:hypothetical protein